MSSSNQPQMPLRTERCIDSIVAFAYSPLNASRSTGGSNPAIVSISSSADVASSKPGASPSRKRSSASGPASAAPNSSMFSGPMPPVHSNPAASRGATAATAEHASTRSGNRAAQASECGPPPEPPVV